MYTESFENLIYGDDGQSPIRPMLMRVLTDVKKDAVRLRIDIRTTPQGTNNSRNEAQLVIDPDETDADGIMRILVERLNDSPGEGFLGQVRMNFSEAGASGRRYASWTRTIRAPSPASRISTPSEEGEEEVEDDDDNSSTSFGRGGGSEHSRRGGGVLLDESNVRLWMETMMGYVFRSQAQQFAMFERATRMMESYTLRFGFQTHEPGIAEIRGGEAPPGSPGPPSGFGLLPMLVAAATKIAAGGSDPAPAPVQANIVPSLNRQNRTAAISGAGRSVRALRGPPPPRQPAEGWSDPPEIDDEPETGSSESWEDEEEEEEATSPPSRSERHRSDRSDRSEREETGLAVQGTSGPDLTGMSAEEMKAAVIAWIRADPSRKADVMGMLPDLSNEIT